MVQIKKDTSLRKAILQAAITGQLISGVERTTETGKQLLDTIKKERDILVTKGIVKKENSGKSELNLTSMDFEIPANWVFAELQQIFRFVDYRGMTPNKNGSEVFLITASNIRPGFMDYTRKEYISRMEYDTRKSRGITKRGDLLFTTEAPMGNAAICDLDECSCGQRIITFQNFKSPLINLKLYMYFINSPAFQQQLLDNCTGTTAKGIKSEKLQRLIIPLPPLAVQNAIVEKLEQLLPLVDAYENAVLQKEELKTALPDKVKKAILQEAITGQLTETWRKTANIKENGKQLLDRIIEERNAKALAEWEETLKKNPKAKKPATIVASEIEEEDIPFEVPESWCWCRLGDVGDFVRGSGIKRDETRPDGYPCIRYGEMYTKYKTVINETVSFVDKDVFDSCQKIIKNDIAMALTGENEYDIALAAVYTGDKEVAMGGDMTRLRPCFGNPLYLVFAINSPYGIQCKSELATGNIIVHISNDKLGSIMIPLPPLEEQNEIVNKVDELISVCK